LIAILEPGAVSRPATVLAPTKEALAEIGWADGRTTRFEFLDEEREAQCHTAWSTRDARAIAEREPGGSRHQDRQRAARAPASGLGP
jgi:hypothetical protein